MSSGPSSSQGSDLIAGWGNCPRVAAREIASEDLERDEILTDDAVTIARGMGRSYGDASLPSREHGRVITTRLSDRWIELDRDRGILRAESGVTLRRLTEKLLEHGWFVPVCPGTQDVTLGGMVAADVHGKNHHRAGTIGRWVRALRIRISSDRVVDCSPDRASDLYWATVGGMGLTGIITAVEVQLERVPSPWIWQRTTSCRGIDELSGQLREASEHYPFSVGWVDLFAAGRSLLFAGRWANPHEVPARRFVPAPVRRIPSFPLSPALIRLANVGYRLVNRPGARWVGADRFFFPLDSIAGWNRFYGRSGFTQYQCVVPWGDDGGGARRVTEALLELGGMSYLTVVKDFGARGEGLLSFPEPGVTVTFDIPIQGEKTASLVRELNERVIDWGGRIYLAKDAFTTAAQFRRMEPRLSEFVEVRRRWKLDARFRSALSRRLGIDETKGD